MTGIADAPKTVKSGDLLSYVVKQTDKDTYSQPAFAPQVGLLEDINPECNIEPIAIRSLKPFAVARRGSDPTATWTYDVVGGAASVQAPTVKIDEWSLINTHPDGDIAQDNPVTIHQTVLVKPLASSERIPLPVVLGIPPSLPNARKNKPLPRTMREIASVALRADLLEA